MTIGIPPVIDAAQSVGTNADRAYEIMREQLIMLEIRPGEPINERGHRAPERGARAGGSAERGWAIQARREPRTVVIERCGGEGRQ